MVKTVLGRVADQLGRQNVLLLLYIDCLVAKLLLRVPSLRQVPIVKLEEWVVVPLLIQKLQLLCNHVVAAHVQVGRQS